MSYKAKFSSFENSSKLHLTRQLCALLKDEFYHLRMSENIPESHRNPLVLFQEWIDLAAQSEVNDPNAAALATAGADGRPSVRMVLIKHFNQDGFRFFTNALSPKGRELAQNPWASLCIHWKSLRRQVRVDGRVTKLGKETSEKYFNSRSRRSRIAAAVSHQSHPLADQLTLDQAVEEFTIQFDGLEVPMPESWIGFTLKPEKIEFWTEREARLHHRVLFTQNHDSWKVSLLYP